MKTNIREIREKLRNGTARIYVQVPIVERVRIFGVRIRKGRLEVKHASGRWYKGFTMNDINEG